MLNEFIYNGKRCFIVGKFRARRSGTSWGYHNSVCIRYDDGTSESVPSGKFHASAKAVQTRNAGDVAPMGDKELS